MKSKQRFDDYLFIIRRTTIPANAAIVPIMDACHTTTLRLPKTKAEFETLVAIAERELRPRLIASPASGVHCGSSRG